MGYITKQLIINCVKTGMFPWYHTPQSRTIPIGKGENQPHQNPGRYDCDSILTLHGLWCFFHTKEHWPPVPELSSTSFWAILPLPVLQAQVSGSRDFPQVAQAAAESQKNPRVCSRSISLTVLMTSTNTPTSMFIIVTWACSLLLL